MSATDFTIQRLAVIMFTDMVGFSRITAADTARARELNEIHHQIIIQCLNLYSGRVRQTTGDGYYIEFQSATKALDCALKIQTLIKERNTNVSEEQRFEIRIGLHAGDVYEKNGDLFGQTINIAARLEPLAKPNHVCLSRGFYDLIKLSPSAKYFVSKGPRSLKNIQGDFEIFENSKSESGQIIVLQTFTFILKSFFRFVQKDRGLAITSLSAYLFILLFVVISYYQKVDSTSSSRNPASALVNPIDSTWKINFVDDQWIDYEAKSSWQFADQISGPFKLKNEVVVHQVPRWPVMVLGLVGDSHKVYFNGHFVGGSEHLSQLATYSIDPSLIKLPPEQNTIEVHAETRKSLNPGVVYLSQVKPQISEGYLVENLKAEYYFDFFVIRTLFLAFSAIVFCLSLILLFYLGHRQEILYSCLFLLFGTLHYMYYNPYLNSLFEYPFLRFIRLNSVLASSFVLAAGYYYLKGVTKWSKVHLVGGLIATGLIYGLLNFDAQMSAVKFVSIYNSSLLVGLIYTGLTAFLIIVTEIKDFKKYEWQRFLFLAALFLHMSSYFGAFKNAPSDALFSANVRGFLGEFGLALPFVFAVFRVIFAAVEMGQEKVFNQLHLKKQNFQLSLAHVLSSSDTADIQFKKIFRQTLNFVQAEHGQLLLGTSTSFKIIESSVLQVDEVPNPETWSHFSKGILKYVETAQQAIVIQNVATDPRFNLATSQRYKGTSCLIVPLKHQNTLIGFMTFSDKKDLKAFTTDELESAVYASSLLSLVYPQTNLIKAA